MAAEAVFIRTLRISISHSATFYCSSRGAANQAHPGGVLRWDGEGWTVYLCRLGNGLEQEGCLELEQSEAYYVSNHPQQTHILKPLEV